MSSRIGIAFALAILSVPAAAQSDIEDMIKRLQSIPASSTKVDCDAQLAKAETANAFDLFYGASVCSAAKQMPESSFLLLAGQTRATPDMSFMMPAAQKDAQTATGLYGFIYSYAGGLGDEKVLRDKASRDRLYALLNQWKPVYDSNYNPGWATRRRPDEASYSAALTKSAKARRETVEKMAHLYSDDTYYALHRKEFELYAAQKDPIEVDSPVAKELGDLARKMNERAAALGLSDVVQPDPSVEMHPEESSRDMPPDTPARDEQVIDGANDAVAKRCADSAEWSAISANARIGRVLITKTKTWGTVWRADLEGGDRPAERYTCTEHSTSSRPLEMGAGDRLPPLPEAKAISKNH